MSVLEIFGRYHTRRSAIAPIAADDNTTAPSTARPAPAPESHQHRGTCRRQDHRTTAPSTTEPSIAPRQPRKDTGGRGGGGVGVAGGGGRRVGGEVARGRGVAGRGRRWACRQGRGWQRRRRRRQSGRNERGDARSPRTGMEEEDKGLPTGSKVGLPTRLRVTVLQEEEQE